MTDHSALMTLARMQIVQLRQNALVFHALVARGVLLPKEAADLFQEPAAFLDEEQYDAETVSLFRESIDLLTKEIAALRPGKPLQSPQRRSRSLAGR